MKSEKLSNKPISSRLGKKELLVSVFAFLLGIAVFALFKPSFIFESKKVLTVVNIDYRVFGCVFLFLIVQLSSFSIIGSLIIPIAECFFGVFLSLLLDSIISFNGFSFSIIYKLFLFSLCLIFLSLYLSTSAINSSDKLLRKTGKDKRIRYDFIKTLVVLIIIIVLSIFGISDINTIL